jgi:hypothetical protein
MQKTADSKDGMYRTLDKNKTDDEKDSENQDQETELILQIDHNEQMMLRSEASRRSFTSGITSIQTS